MCYIFMFHYDHLLTTGQKKTFEKTHESSAIKVELFRFPKYMHNQRILPNINPGWMSFLYVYAYVNK